MSPAQSSEARAAGSEMRSLLELLTPPEGTCEVPRRAGEEHDLLGSLLARIQHAFWNCHRVLEGAGWLMLFTTATAHEKHAFKTYTHLLR